MLNFLDLPDEIILKVLYFLTIPLQMNQKISLAVVKCQRELEELAMIILYG